MKKLLSALQTELDSFPAVGEIDKPRRGAYRPYSWRMPALGSSGVFNGIGLHHYTSLKTRVPGERIEQIVYHIVCYAAAGFSGGSLQTTLGNTLGFNRSEKNMLLPNHYGLVGNLRAAYRPALVARLLKHIATEDDLETKEAADKLLVCVDGKWQGFDRDRWVIGGFKHPFRESFYPPAARVNLADLIDNTPYHEEVAAPEAMRWLKQEKLLTPELELTLKIAHVQRGRWTARALRKYEKGQEHDSRQPSDVPDTSKKRPACADPANAQRGIPAVLPHAGK